MFRFGVDSFIWSESFSDRDLWIIPKAKELGFEVLDIAVAHPETFPTRAVKEKADEVGIELVTSTTLGKNTNLISPQPEVRQRGIDSLKLLVNINLEIGSRIMAGVIYAGWGYLTGRSRTEQEWEWSVASLRQVAKYAQGLGELTLAVEPVNRFESHFLNVAEDAAGYCRDVGTGNVKVHLDTFHMIREETNYTEAVKVCGNEFLGYVHLCENNRGIPGTGLVPWMEFFEALRDVQYDGPVVIESFDPGCKELSRLCAIWRTFAESGEELAVKGFKNLRAIAQTVLQK